MAGMRGWIIKPGIKGEGKRAVCVCVCVCSVHTLSVLLIRPKTGQTTLTAISTKVTSNSDFPRIQENIHNLVDLELECYGSASWHDDYFMILSDLRSCHRQEYEIQSLYLQLRYFGMVEFG